MISEQNCVCNKSRRCQIIIGRWEKLSVYSILFVKSCCANITIKIYNKWGHQRVGHPAHSIAKTFLCVWMLFQLLLQTHTQKRKRENNKFAHAQTTTSSSNKLSGEIGKTEKEEKEVRVQKAKEKSVRTILSMLTVADRKYGPVHSTFYFNNVVRWWSFKSSADDENSPNVSRPSHALEKRLE